MAARAILLIAWCIVSETIEQMLYRGAGDRKGAARYLGFYTPAITLHIVRLAVWLTVLKTVPLGIALPLLGANYAAIALAGRLVFHERIDRKRFIGIALVLIGFILVSAQGLEAP